MDLDELIKNTLSGDEESFRFIIKDYSQSIRIYLSRHLSDSHKVDDLCQEIFIAVYWNLDSYNNQYSFRTWIQAIAKNKLMSYFRSHYSQQKMMLEVKSQICELIDEEPSLEGEDHSRVDQLKVCISKQSKENSDLLKWRYFERVSVIEIAENLNTTVSAISSQLYRLRGQLKNCIERGLTS